VAALVVDVPAHEVDASWCANDARRSVLAEPPGEEVEHGPVGRQVLLQSRVMWPVYLPETPLQARRYRFEEGLPTLNRTELPPIEHGGLLMSANSLLRWR